MALLTENQLSGEININLSWKGFPTPVTSAMSVPNSKKPDGFDYLVFAGRKYRRFVLQLIEIISSTFLTW